MRESYRTAFRIPSQGLTLPALNDPILMILQQAADFRLKVSKKKQKEEDKAKDALDESKEGLEDFDESPGASPAAAPAAALPDSDSFNPEVTSLAQGFSLRKKISRVLDLPG